jgi:pyruvate/2-oxoglutarate/acetoin dehydrogenase E1 component
MACSNLLLAAIKNPDIMLQILSKSEVYEKTIWPKNIQINLSWNDYQFKFNIKKEGTTLTIFRSKNNFLTNSNLEKIYTEHNINPEIADFVKYCAL